MMSIAKVQAAFTVGFLSKHVRELVVSCVVSLDGVVMEGGSSGLPARISDRIKCYPSGVVFRWGEAPMTGSKR